MATITTETWHDHNNLKNPNPIGRTGWLRTWHCHAGLCTANLTYHKKRNTTGQIHAPSPPPLHRATRSVLGKTFTYAHPTPYWQPRYVIIGKLTHGSGSIPKCVDFFKLQTHYRMIRTPKPTDQTVQRFHFAKRVFET